jgi:hypothetical protein
MIGQPKKKSFVVEKRVAGAFVLALTAYLACPQVANGASSLLFASNLGGNQWDAVRAIATDASQNIYVVGETYSPDFPGAVWSSSRQTGDAFIVKLSSTGTRIYSVVLGGSGYDSARGVAVDSAGNVYVTGMTSSLDFPTTAGAFQRNSGSPGQYDAFVVKLNPAGTVVYATYLGGASSDAGYGIAVDSTGAAYVAGSTNSMNFPVTGSAPQSRFGGGTDCFVAKLDPTGATLNYATYLGGENMDSCASIAVDGAGDAFVTGTTSSAHFPVVAALDATLAGTSDAFLTKVSPAGDSFLFSTYLGGEAADNGNVVRLDSAGNAYVAGDTMSVGFPVTSGELQTQLSGSYDGFLCSIANDGSAIRFATYIGGSGSDSIRDLFVAPDGGITVAGYTASMDFPLMNPVQSSFGGTFDAFVTVVGPNGGYLLFSTYLGGGGDDRAWGVAALATGQLVFAGQVMSGTVPSMQQVYGSTPAGQYDGFLAAISYAASASTQGLRFVPVTPCRVADTRNATGPFGGPSIAGGTSRDFVIPNSACGVPATAQAYSVNITVVPMVGLGHLTVWPSGQPQAPVSTLNSWDGRAKSNSAIIPAGSGGAISIFASDTSHVVLDINGYFVPASNASALAFYSMTPCRIADTRWASGPFGGPALVAMRSRTFPIRQSTCNIPVGTQAYALNLTAVPNAPVGYLIAWAAGLPIPLAYSLFVQKPTPTADAAIVAADTAGSIQVFAQGATDLIIDINGYFAPPAAGGMSLYNVTPCRIVDTRNPAGTPPIIGTMNVDVVSSSCGIPGAGEAYVLNVTALPPVGLGHLTLWPQGEPQPWPSTLNSWDGALANNLAIIPAISGVVSAFASDPTYLIFDIFGYFAP